MYRVTITDTFIIVKFVFDFKISQYISLSQVFNCCQKLFFTLPVLYKLSKKKKQQRWQTLKYQFQYLPKKKPLIGRSLVRSPPSSLYCRVRVRVWLDQRRLDRRERKERKILYSLRKNTFTSLFHMCSVTGHTTHP